MDRNTLNIRKHRLIIISIVIITSLYIVSYYYMTITIQQNLYVHIAGKDKFGIKEIYKTKERGREWFINMDNPVDDKIFSISSHVPISRNNDDNGSWFINNSAVRMNINTPAGEPLWKDIEMTGYVKVKSIFGGNGSDEIGSGGGKYLSPSLDWRARGGSHSDDVPCEGTALNGGLDIVSKIASWKKEIWHTGGYTDARDKKQATDKSLLGRWIGWKVIMYNIDDNKAVKMESYLDDNNNNEWKKVTNLIDKGGWYANSLDKIFYTANCGKPKDYIMTNGGPIATFRSDNTAFDFKYFSVREIQP